MTRITSLFFTVVFTALVVYFGYPKKVNGVPADIRFNQDETKAEISGLPLSRRPGGTPTSRDLSKNDAVQVLRRSGNTTTSSNGITTNGTLAAGPGEFVQASFETNKALNSVSEVLNMKGDSDSDFDSLSQAPGPSAASNKISSTSGSDALAFSSVYYLVCGGSTSMTLGDDIFDTLFLSFVFARSFLACDCRSR